MNEFMIEMENIEKTFKVLKRREGLVGTFKDLFSRNYKYIKAVDDISLKVRKGEILGCLGPNGAGKSTIIKMMTGVLEPSKGTIVVNGRSPYKQRTQTAQEIGVVFGQRSQLWWSLPVIESFKILRKMYRIQDATYKRNIEIFESLVDIDKLYSKPVRQMSLGQRTLCDILASFLHDPKIVFLDEPTIGLDVSIKAKIRRLIMEFNKEKDTTVILTTHDMGDVEALCKSTLIIDKGKIIYNDCYEKLKSLFGAYRHLKINVSPVDVDKVTHTLNSLSDDPNMLTLQQNEDWIDILINEDRLKVVELLNVLMGKFTLNDLKVEDISAESVVRKIYEGGAKEWESISP